MLRLGKLTDYATVILSFMANGQAKIYATLEIVLGTGLSKPTVSKILKLLVKAQLLSSVRGVKGGYSLIKSPDKITIASVITALEGPISLTECSVNHDDENCEKVASCQIGNNWRVVNRRVQQALESVTLADMLLPTERPYEVTIPVASLYR